MLAPPPWALLRTRGGISLGGRDSAVFAYSSPHTRRYFRNHGGLDMAITLFSAHAEVFPDSYGVESTSYTLLRTRGGISGPALVLSDEAPSSPHTRRYFRCGIGNASKPLLFSAHAEVFPITSNQAPKRDSLLRTRGGISFWQ